MISETLGAVAAAITAAWEPTAKKTAAQESRPRTLVLAAVNPPRTLGLWERELLIAAGATGLANPEAHDLTAAELTAFAPEVIVIVGEDTEGLTELEGWFALPAVTEHEVYLVEPAYISEVGEGLAEAARVLATILHPDIFTQMLPSFSVQLAPLELFTPPSPDDAESDG
ncbi:ABC transporter substrate-binding protein [Armatimonas rosea]|uniref:ABC-type Fe3+-hydroxamate transport system substrate-binding protein n=1 Tax=Armatimonas rosea TaxID=685828 RepID=A0A7W9W5T0_ARMRO|nr:ABC transporter substrate-binding protein [Armatimonas rosea]MBB6049366.1 ABC-type Fe3+-hydroxamate transport system substrate-binding protein [Armatimonas rosea]